MFKMIDPRWVINATIIALALTVFGLTLDAGWDAYDRYRKAQNLERANAFANRVVDTLSTTATERGITAAALGSAGPTDAETTQIIIALRTRAETELSAILAATRDLAPSAHFTTVIEQAKRAHNALQAARVLADRSLAQGPSIGVDAWIGVTTAYIASMEHMRRDAFSNNDDFNEIATLNLSLRHWAWLASEHTGLERGILAHYISAARPVPPPVLTQLQAYRGVAENNLDELRAQGAAHEVSAAAQPAIDAMNRELHRFDATRARIYASTTTGAYPLTGRQWMEQATAAVDSILAVTKTISQVTDDQMETIKQASTWHLARHAALLGVTLVLVLLSLTKVRLIANTLFRDKELAEITLQCIGDAVITTNAEARVEYLNPIAEEMTGWRNTEAAGRPLREVFQIINGFSRAPDPNPVEECLRENRVVGLGNNTVLVRRDGAEFTVEDSAAPIHDREGRVVGAVMVFYDVSAQRGTPHLMSHYATHDALTGLINRREFERRLSELLTSAKRLGQHHALCYMDLDQFKVVNDTCGHAVGDRLLRQLTYLLHQHVRDSDTLARLGGDEFGVLLENCPLGKALQIVEELRLVAKNFRFVWEDKSFEISASIGLVPITSDSISPAEALSEADAACYAAKDKGRNRVQVYEHGDLELARRHGEMQWVSRLTRALEENRFELYVQLIAPLTPDNAPHHEILLRLRDEEGELVAPMCFIPAAERYDLMPDIDRWVIRTTLQILDRCGWACTAAPLRYFSINISGASINNPTLLGYIREQLAAHHIDPRRICFEITETAAVSNLEQAANFMKALKTDGCRFALDDFGSGLSSFMYLKNLPVDYLKIDGNFVNDIVEDPIDYAMVEAINTIGHVMGMLTIAEFVENDQILEKLRMIGVDFAQGYGIERPQPLADCIHAFAANY